MPSTAIADIQYEQGRKRLTVTFLTGRIYQYSGVPAELAADFKASRSKGTFFNHEIRDRYRFREITPR